MLNPFDWPPETDSDHYNINNNTQTSDDTNNNHSLQPRQQSNHLPNTYTCVSLISCDTYHLCNQPIPLPITCSYCEVECSASSVPDVVCSCCHQTEKMLAPPLCCHEWPACSSQNQTWHQQTLSERAAASVSSTLCDFHWCSVLKPFPWNLCHRNKHDSALYKFRK